MVGRTKEQFRENTIPKRVSHVRFGIMDADELRRLSVMQVREPELYTQPHRQPTPYGPLDRRLGTSSKSGKCDTCGERVQNCAGHFGHIKLVLPVFHVGYFKATVAILQKICKTCSRVLLTASEFESFRKKIALGSVSRKELNKQILERGRRVKNCPHCNAYNGSVKKIAAFKLVHERYGVKCSESDRARFHESFQHANEVIKDLPTLINQNKAQEIMDPLRVLNLFKRIPDEDCAVLDLNASQSRPESLLITHLLVPPACIRPSVLQDASGGSNEDDLTMLLREILFFNNYIIKHAEVGATLETINEDWEFMQLKCVQYINSETSGLPPTEKTKPTRGFCQRLKGKQGRFRGNLSGKRVDFSSRSVISPDPNLRIDQVGVPQYVAKTLTYPEMVNRHNIKRLRQAIINGPDKHPGANFLSRGENQKYGLDYGNRKMRAKELRIGDVVERHLIDGDIVLFNRQPSLHKLSIMSHFVKVLPWRTFRFNECVCNPYNADFDGDEMNLHVPQTEEARTEALVLMGTKSNICTPRDGGPLIAPIQDFLTGGYLLTSKDTFLTRTEICELAIGFAENDEPLVLPPPCIVRPVELWSGKQALTMLMLPTASQQTYLNMESETKNYKRDNCKYTPGTLYTAQCSSAQSTEEVFGRFVREHLELVTYTVNVSGLPVGDVEWIALTQESGQGRPLCLHTLDLTTNKAADGISIEGKWVPALPELRLFEQGKLSLTVATSTSAKLISTSVTTKASTLPRALCPDDGFIKFSNGVHISGQLDKSTLGGGSKKSVFYRVLRDAGEQAAADGMGRLAKLCLIFLRQYGFSIGLGDVTPSKNLLAFKADLCRQGYETCNKLIRQFETGRLDTEPGMSADETLEKQVNKVLSDIRSKIGQQCRLELPRSNAPAIMVRAGSKGNTENMSQMIACVGQQSISGNRIPNGFEDRSLPHFPRLSRAPAAKGFVQNSFYSGLTPSEFFFHTMGGREGLVDTAVKTADTGYMQRRLMKALEDLSTQYDMTVRNSVGTMIQFCYGDDGLDPTYMELREDPVDLGHMYLQLGQRTTVRDGKLLLPYEINAVADVYLQAQEDALVEPRDSDVTKHKIKFFNTLRQFWADKATQIGNARKKRGLTPMMSDSESSSAGLADPKARKLAENLVNAVYRITKSDIEYFLETALYKYQRASMEPGTAVGALGAQSIGEPGTQMTLKTFHFSGLASMNVTQGVPRIKEIINASKKISTPIVTARLEVENDEAHSRIVKGRMEPTYLEQVCEYMQEVYDPEGDAHVVVKLDMSLIKKLYLEVDVFRVRRAILGATKLKLTDADVVIASKSKLRVYPSATMRKSTAFAAQALKTAMGKILVQGIASVTRVVVERMDGGKFQLLAEGDNLRPILITPGVDGRRTRCNHIMEIEKTLGIEAARLSVMHEISTTMEHHGLFVDSRHVMLLGDLMTFKGEVLGITRFGIAKMKQSVFMLASFEKTADHLFDAALHGSRDPISGVSECIIMGIPMNVGTGLFQLLQRADKKPDTARRPLLFEQPDLHCPLGL
eukprot:m.44963 g.44963  ORF g.44963 m.44963 type:complete len:1535 (+) comp11747_c0_seq1:191-4795(+)